VRVAFRDAPPDSDGVCLSLCIRIEPRIAIAVVDVGSGLPARRAVQIDDDVNSILARPSHQAIHQLEALGIVAVEEFPVAWHPNGVEPRLLHTVDVCFRDVGLAPLFPERRGLLGTDELPGELLDLSRRLRAVVEMEHVPFGFEPVSQVNTAQHQQLAVPIHDLWAGGVYEVGLSKQGRRARKTKQSAENKELSV